MQSLAFLNQPNGSDVVSACTVAHGFIRPLRSQPGLDSDGFEQAGNAIAAEQKSAYDFCSKLQANNPVTVETLLRCAYENAAKGKEYGHRPKS